MISARRELIVVLALIATLTCVNLVTGSRSPTVWQDEVQVADAAINSVLGNGFTSTVSPFRDGALFARTTLYPLALVPWLSVFGIGPLAARSLGILLAACAALLAWRGAVRWGRLRGAGLRAAVPALVLCGYGMARTYRSGRYDSVAILLVCTGWWAFHDPSRRRAVAWLFGLSLLGAFAGPYVPAYGVLVALLIVLAAGRAGVSRAAAVFAGTLASAVAFGGVHAALGTYSEMVASFSGPHALPASVPDRIATTAAALPGVLLTDWSTSILLVVLAACAFLIPRERRGDVVRALVTGIVAFVAIPVVFMLLGRYRSYYTWTAFLPVALAALAVLDGTLAVPVARWKARTLATGVVLALLVGLPARTAVTVLQWDARDPLRAASFVEQNVSPDDDALIGYQAYYGARLHARSVTSPGAAGYLTAEDYARIDVIVAEPGLAERFAEAAGGRWREVDRLAPSTERLRAPWLPYLGDPQWGPSVPTTAQLYPLIVLRRER